MDEERELVIWGYDTFGVYETREDGRPDYEGGFATHEFLRKLTSYLEPGKEFEFEADYETGDLTIGVDEEGRQS